MATFTTIMGLTKPNVNEYFNIESFNVNADLIEKFIAPIVIGNGDIIDYSNAFFVDGTNGSNSNGGTTEATAWATISYAAAHSSVVAGKTVYVRTGTYNEQVKITKHGTALSRITFRNYPNETPVVDGTGITWSSRFDEALIDLNSAEGIIIKGFEVSNSYGVGIGRPLYKASPIKIESKYLTIENCYIHNVQGSGISFLYSMGVNAYNNILDYVNQNTAVSAEAITVCECHGGEISYNTISNIGLTTPSTARREGIDIKDGSNHMRVHHNIIYPNAYKMGIYIDAFSNAQYDNEVYENIIIGGHTGIQIGVEYGGSLYDCNVHHNYMYNVHGEAISIAHWASGYNWPIDTLKINNNKIYRQYYDGTTGGSMSCGIWIYNPDCTNVEIKENIISGTSAIIPIRNGVNVGDVNVSAYDISYNSINHVHTGGWPTGTNYFLIGNET